MSSVTQIIDIEAIIEELNPLVSYDGVGDYVLLFDNNGNLLFGVEL
jgi:hypothetical protein